MTYLRLIIEWFTNAVLISLYIYVQSTYWITSNLSPAAPCIGAGWTRLQSHLAVLTSRCPELEWLYHAAAKSNAIATMTFIANLCLTSKFCRQFRRRWNARSETTCRPPHCPRTQHDSTKPVLRSITTWRLQISVNSKTWATRCISHVSRRHDVGLHSWLQLVPNSPSNVDPASRYPYAVSASTWFFARWHRRIGSWKLKDGARRFNYAL